MLKEPTEEMRHLVAIHAEALFSFINDTRISMIENGNIDDYTAHAVCLNSVSFIMTTLIVEAIGEIHNKLVISQTHKTIQEELNKIIEKYGNAPNN